LSDGFARRLRHSTAVRFVLLYLALNLVVALPVFAYIYEATNRLVMREFHEIVADETRLLHAEYRTGGLPTVVRTIEERIASGAAVHGAFLLADPTGSIVIGNLRAWPPTLRGAPPWSEMLLYRRGHERPERIGFSVTRFPSGHRLLVGRVLEDRRRLRQSLAVALAGALLLGIPLGLVGSVVLLRFMSSRVRSIARVAERVAEGEFERRIETHGTRDPFDQLSASLNAMFKRLERLVGELRIVTDGLAHDLRSPLTRMRASIDRAVAGDDPAARDQALEAVAREIQAMLRMLTGTLEVSRLEAGIGRESFATFDLAGLVRDLCEMYQPLAEESGLTMEVRAPDHLSYFGSRELVGQAVSNLIDNALKYGAGGGRIEILLEQARDHLRLGVADRGPGIRPENRDEALRKYRRLDAARSAEGTGLGLALAGAVARLHGGDIRIEDNEPGLRVILSLPLADGTRS
jgi:signal transduction histidine kinase